eukprot:3616230-Karenia_brevis.AAC.1
MEENLWLPDELPQPFLEKMPALSAARRSSVTAKGMAKAILSECASCNTQGFLSSRVRVHIVDGQELFQCEECYVELECDSKEISPTQWREENRRQVEEFCSCR